MKCGWEPSRAQRQAPVVSLAAGCPNISPIYCAGNCIAMYVAKVYMSLICRRIFAPRLYSRLLYSNSRRKQNGALVIYSKMITRGRAITGRLTKVIPCLYRNPFLSNAYNFWQSYWDFLTAKCPSPKFPDGRSTCNSSLTLIITYY